jgi:hypothetical protein
MIAAWPEIDARVLATLDGTPSKVPVVLGGDASGRTTALRRIASAVGDGRCQYLDLERVTSTPERFLGALTEGSPFQLPAGAAGTSTRAAFEQALEILGRAGARDGGPATFVIDEWLELQTFEHFPGLRTAVRDTVATLAGSPNRFVLGSRFTSRTLRRLAEASDRFVIVTAPEASTPSIAAELMEAGGYLSDVAEDLATTIVAIAGGRQGYAHIIAQALLALPPPGDPIASLVASMSPGAPLDRMCRYSYEYRLHRARGYGALKAILGILAQEEPLTLTDIAVRMGRTAGSTRDYLGWLEDVDLVVSHRKHYSFTDPLLRVWVSLFDRPAPPSEETLASGLQRYAIARLTATRPNAG